MNVLRVQAVGGDIRESTALKVGIVSVVLLGLIVDIRQILRNGEFLVPSPGEVVGETAGRGVPGILGAHTGCTTNCRHVGASGRENGVELGSDTVSGLAGRADTCTC